MDADMSYPPSILALSSKHDLKLVGTINPPLGLHVDFTWDSSGKTATIDFGDGESETTDAEQTSHEYDAHGTYSPTVRSGRASDSATLNMEQAEEPEDEEPEDESA